jgi:cyclopropane fatty-acyl-phospholipid synthase-like methyltransferase
MMKNLDLYAKIEALIGFDEAYEELYEIYLKKLQNYPIKTLLDLGCGNGNFLLKAQKIYEAEGIDLSKDMVNLAREKGANAKRIDLDKLDKKFDCIVAIGDVLNYIKPDKLKEFFIDIKESLNEDGIFIFDVNTLHGFEDVTAGSMVVDKDDEFLSIDAEYFAGVLRSEIVHFQKEGECFKREKEDIFQYFHDDEEIKKATTMKILDRSDLCMFSDESDKRIFVFKKINLNQTHIYLPNGSD